MSGLSFNKPWPYDAFLGSVGVMLIPDPQTGTIKVASATKPFEAVSPPDYSYGAIPPNIEQATEFRRLLMGMGERRSQFREKRRYLYADGLDLSINGQPMLGPGLHPITPASTGAQSGLYEALSAGVLKPFLLAGTYVLVGNNTMVAPGDWTVSLNVGQTTLSARRFQPAGYVTRLITNATNASPIAITSVAHGFTTGMSIVVANVLGNTAANGTWTITVVDADHFSLNGSTGNGVYTSGGTATQSAVIKDSLYVTTSGGHLLWYDGTSDTTAWTDITTGLNLDPAMQKASYLEVHDGLLFRAWNNYVCSVSADPTTPTNWNAVIQVGDAAHPITWLKELSGTLYIFKTDGIWIINANGVAEPLFPDLLVTADTSYGQQAAVWQSQAFFHYGDGFYSLGPNTTGQVELHPVGPERFMENDSPVAGVVTASVGWNNWFLYFTLYNATLNTSYLMKLGAWYNEDQQPYGSSPYVRRTVVFDPLSASGSFFEPVVHGAIATWAGKKATTLAVTSLPGPNQRLVVGFADGSISYITLPRGGPNPQRDPNCDYQTAGYLYLGTHTMQFPSIPKAYRGATVFGTTLDGSNTAEIAYRLAPSGAYVPVGTYTTPGQRIDLPTGISGIQVDLRLGLFGPSTSTPLLDGFAWHEALRPDLLLESTLPIKVRDNVALRDGSTDWRSAASVRSFLRSIADAKGTISAIFPEGDKKDITVDDYQESLASHQRSYGPAWDIVLKVVEFQPIIAYGTVDRLQGYTVDSLIAYTVDQLGGL